MFSPKFMFGNLIPRAMILRLKKKNWKLLILKGRVIELFQFVDQSPFAPHSQGWAKQKPGAWSATSLTRAITQCFAKCISR